MKIWFIRAPANSNAPSPTYTIFIGREPKNLTLLKGRYNFLDKSEYVF